VDVPERAETRRRGAAQQMRKDLVKPDAAVAHDGGGERFRLAVANEHERCRPAALGAAIERARKQHRRQPRKLLNVDNDCVQIP